VDGRPERAGGDGVLDSLSPVRARRSDPAALRR
jgi:hypothetical protein